MPANDASIPVREIMTNAALEPSVVLSKVREQEGNYGVNAQTTAYGDMIWMWVLDPSKVVRVALQNATSIAGLRITTEVMIATGYRSHTITGRSF